MPKMRGTGTFARKNRMCAKIERGGDVAKEIQRNWRGVVMLLKKTMGIETFSLCSPSGGYTNCK